MNSSKSILNQKSRDFRMPNLLRSGILAFLFVVKVSLYELEKNSLSNLIVLFYHNLVLKKVTHS